MISLFADTYYFLALLNKKDAAHRRAVSASQGLSRAVMTSAWVLTEVGDALSARRERLKFVDLLGTLRASPAWTIVPPTEEVFDEAVRLYASRADKDWSLTDCTSFVIMTRHGLAEALTGDAHFEQAGFRTLLR